MTRTTEPKAWERAMAARAMGQQPAPEDLAEAQRAARPATTGWAQRLAERAVQRREPRAGRSFDEALRERLGADRVGDNDPPPDAA
jgi:hypothetical protein